MSINRDADRLKATVRRYFESTIPQYIDRYRKTNNPLFLWFAYRICRKHDVPIPDEVFSYFDATADNLAALVDTIKEKPKGQKAIKDMLQALGLRKAGKKDYGPGNELSDYLRATSREEMAVRVSELIRYGLDETNAIDRVASEFRESRSTVRRACIVFS